MERSAPVSREMESLLKNKFQLIEKAKFVLSKFFWLLGKWVSIDKYLKAYEKYRL